MIRRREFLTLLGGTAAGLCSGLDSPAEPKAAGGQSENVVFLTSDDGPGAATGTIIDIAERHQVPITLFMIGMSAAASAEHRGLLERAHRSEWVTVGNHSYSHCLSHYVQCYHDTKSIVSDFERASKELGLVSCPTPARGPGRNVWRLPGMRLDDPAISFAEMGIEDTTDDTLFAKGFYLYGWDVEWVHDSRGIPVLTSSTMVDQLADSVHHSSRPGKVVMLMHDVMMRAEKTASELTRIIEGVRNRGARFGRLSEYKGIYSPTSDLRPLLSK
jgi:peptidoglycan/xylan/chitin deacetylase (PgdA/CDA1 family)